MFTGIADAAVGAVCGAIAPSGVGGVEAAVEGGIGPRPSVGLSPGVFWRCNSVDRITTTTRRLALRP